MPDERQRFISQIFDYLMDDSVTVRTLMAILSIAKACVTEKGDERVREFAKELEVYNGRQ